MNYFKIKVQLFKRLPFLLFLFLSITTFSQTSEIDSLEKELAYTKSDSEKLKIINHLVDAAFGIDVQKALYYSKTGVALAEKTKDKIWLPKFYEMQGRMHANMLQLDSASLFFNKAMAGYKAVQDKRGQATTYFKMGWVYKKRGEIEKALETDLAALRLMEDLQDQLGMAGAYERVAEDLIVQGRLKEAKKYAQKAVTICAENDLSNELVYAITIAGSVAINEGNNQEAYDLFNRALIEAKKQNFEDLSLADFYNNRGNALKKLKKYPEALKDYNIAYEMAKKANYTNAIAPTIANLGEVNLLLGNYKEALPFQLETVRLQELNQDNSNLTEAYLHTSTIYEKLNNYEKALEYLKKSMSLNDSIRSVDSDSTMSGLLTKYESKKKENTILAQDKEISQQKKIQWLGGGLLALMLAFIVFGVFVFRIRIKRSRLLAAKNSENELLLKEIHHRVKNNLEVVSSLLALQSAQIEDPVSKEAMEESQNRVHSIGIVHQKLYQGNTRDAIDMKDYFLNLGENVLDSFGVEKRITIELAMEKLDIDIDTAVPLGLIVNELLTNSIKYAFPSGQSGNVRIKLEKQNNGILHMEVSDNGIGKSGLTQGTGFGAQLISLLTRQLSGKMREEFRNGTHILFEFGLPKAV